MQGHLALIDRDRLTSIERQRNVFSERAAELYVKKRDRENADL
jgi:hypothetical protein